MNYYNNIKEQIADYITREPVVETEEVISAYTLFSVLNDENKKLRNAKGRGKALLDKLNFIYPKVTVSNNKKLFKKSVEHNYFDDIWYNINDNHSEIVLSKYKPFGLICLNKDFGYSGVYSKNAALTEEAYEECASDIEKILHELEYVGQLYAGDTEHEYGKVAQTISYGYFDVEISFYKENKEFSYDIHLNKEYDPNFNSNAHYYGQEKTIDNVINKNKETILRNTPINMKDLSYMFCMLVLDYRTKEKEKNIDIEIDKAFQKVNKKISEE